MRDGGFISEGYSSRLDKLRALRNESRRYILDLEEKERGLTYIPTLKIKFNSCKSFDLSANPSIFLM